MNKQCLIKYKKHKTLAKQISPFEQRSTADLTPCRPIKEVWSGLDGVKVLRWKSGNIKNNIEKILWKHKIYFKDNFLELHKNLT
jgi:hypothetical protein